MQGGFFSEWLTSYRHYLPMRNYSARTIQSYEQVVRHFAYYVWLRRNSDPQKLVVYWDDLSKARLDTNVDVKPVLISDYFSFLRSIKTYKPKTLHRMISTLSSFYRFLYAQEAISSNPMLGIERPKIKDQELQYLKHSQEIRLIESIEDPRDRLIVRAIYATGVRVSELCAMDIGDIDFEEETIRVRGKGGTIRIVFVDRDTLDDMATFIDDRIGGPLFPGQEGHHISPRSVQHIFKEALLPYTTVEMSVALNFTDGVHQMDFSGVIRWCRRKEDSRNFLYLGIKFNNLTEDNQALVKNYMSLGQGDKNLIWNLWDSMSNHAKQ